MSITETDWETREELLRAAGSAGYKLSAAQLGRLHRAGLIPGPRVRALGRAKGTVSEFPPCTSQRLVRVLEVKQHERRLSYVAWRLWWDDGGALAPAGRQLLAQTAERWEQARTELAALLAAEDAGDPRAEAEMDALYREAEHERLTAPLSGARRKTGRSGFSSVIRVFAEAATGRFAGYGDAEEPSESPAPGTTAALVEKALGIDRARRDRLVGARPWYEGDSEADFVTLSRLFESVSLRDAAASSDAVLDEARLELRAMLAAVTTIAPLFERLFGRNAFGFATIARGVDVRTPRAQAFLLLGWLALRHDPVLLENMKQFRAAAPLADATVQMHTLLGELASDVPAFAPLLTDNRLAAAQLDGDARRSLAAEIAETRQSNAAAVDEFFSRHPEADELIAAIEDEPE